MSFKVTIPGLPSPLVDKYIVKVIVDQHTRLPSMFEVHILDEMLAMNYKYIDLPTVTIGTPVTIIAYPADPSPLPVAIPLPLIKGEVTAIEASFDEFSRAIMIIRGYDKSHRLHRGRKTKTYLMQNDMAIVSQIAASVGLAPIVTVVGSPQPYVIQNHLTDWEFLQQRASRCGAQVSVDALGLSLHFSAMNLPTVPAPPPILTWGKNLRSFNPRITAAGVGGAAAVKGHHLGLPVIGAMPVTPVAPGGGLPLTADFTLAKTFFGVTKLETVRDLSTLSDATLLAKGLAAEAELDFLQADGVAVGHPGIMAGGKVMIKGVGLRFSGSYQIVRATHVWDSDGLYQTRFSIGGSESGTLASLVDSTERREIGRMHGVVVGVVTNNNWIADLEGGNVGRVKVKFPWMDGMEESNWARIATPMAGGSQGFQFMPEINDEVLVAFEQGDVNRPYVLGGLWTKTSMPPLAAPMAVIGGKVAKRVIKTASGHTLTFTDAPGQEKIEVIDKTLMNKIVIDSVMKTIPIEGTGDINITSKTGKVAVEATAGITLTSKADVAIDCLNFSVKAKVKVAMEGSAGAELKTTGPLQMEGSLVNLKSSGPAAIDGMPVQINKSSLVVLP